MQGRVTMENTFVGIDVSKDQLARITLGLRTPWLGLCSIKPFSILADTPGIGSGLKSPAETNPCAIIARYRE
jgi:hypothetical protein